MAENTEPRRRPWRKRHPVLSRAILYALGAVLVAALVWFWRERQAQDRADHLDYLRARLGQLDLIPSGDELKRVLDEEFSDPDLPSDIRHLALRARAVIHGDKGEYEQAHEVLDRADSLVESEAQRWGVRIERSLLLVRAGHPADALALMDVPAPRAQPVLVIWRALARAEAETAGDRQAAAGRVLDETLGSLASPLPEGPAVHVTLTPWTPSAAAHLATRRLVALPGWEKNGDPWRRLLELAPKDFDVAAAAAQALLELGFRADATKAWRRAGRLSARRAGELAASSPGLRALSEGAD